MCSVPDAMGQKRNLEHLEDLSFVGIFRYPIFLCCLSINQSSIPGSKTPNRSFHITCKSIMGYLRLCASLNVIKGSRSYGNIDFMVTLYLSLLMYSAFVSNLQSLLITLLPILRKTRLQTNGSFSPRSKL